MDKIIGISVVGFELFFLIMAWKGKLYKKSIITFTAIRMILTAITLSYLLFYKKDMGKLMYHIFDFITEVVYPFIIEYIYKNKKKD